MAALTVRKIFSFLSASLIFSSARASVAAIHTSSANPCRARSYSSVHSSETKVSTNCPLAFARIASRRIANSPSSKSLFMRHRRLLMAGNGLVLPTISGAQSGITSISVRQATGIAICPSTCARLRWKIRAKRRKPMPPTFTIETPWAERSMSIMRARVGRRMFSASPSTIMTPLAKKRLAFVTSRNLCKKR